tara:strand:- start:3532 stop:4023 length:492 start_codon:yes stop_codon:yes gene_type:complete
MKNKSLLKIIGVIGALFIAIIFAILIITAQGSNQTTFRTIQGNKFNFNQIENKVTIINFWATWCGPCLVEIPNLMQLKEEYKDKPFEIVGISTDEYLEDVINFHKYQKFNYPVIMANKAIYNKFPPPVGIPFSIILDKNGESSEIFMGYKPIDKFRSAVEKLF